MAGKVVLFWVSFVLSIIYTNAAGELSLFYCPKSITFTGANEVKESALKEIYSAVLGISVEEKSQWNGLYITDPFSTPEAVVEVYIDGVVSLSGAEYQDFKSYPLNVDEFEPDSFDALKHRINQHNQDNENNVIQINLIDTEPLSALQNIFGTIQPEKPTKSLLYLKPSIEEDFQFLTELETLKALTRTIINIKSDKYIDFYAIRFISLHPLSDFHGPNSKQTKEAKTLLVQALKKLSDAFAKTYDGSVLVAVVTTDVAHTRRTVRSVITGPLVNITHDSPGPTEVNNAAMFNIILWFGVVFAFSLIAIVYAIMDMDPGRDSIIYRMTSTRMKKDN